MTNYDKNITALKKVNESLADWVSESDTPDWLTVKDKNALVTKRNRVQLMYPETYFDEIGKKPEVQAFFSDTATVIVGVGLGHLLHMVLANMEPGHRVLVVEPLPGVVKAAFNQQDFSKFIESTEFTIARDHEDITLAVNVIDSTLVIQGWMTLSEPYVTMCEEYFEVINYTMEILDQHRCGVGTVMGAGAVIAENDIRNLPYVINRPGVVELKDRYKGLPCISIATGPSLAKNIHLLRDVQDKFVIICVAQALRVLLAYDIIPDFVTTVDYGPVNYEHFKGLFDHPLVTDNNIKLVALNRTYYKILEKWKSDMYVVGTQVPGYEDTIHGLIEKKGCLEQGGSVSHLSYQLAKHLGCSDVVLLGHNLGYEDGLSHIQQVDAGGKVEIANDGSITWKVTDPQSSLKDKDYAYGSAISVPGFFGEPVLTNVGLASFITTFEAFFKKDADTINVYNATEGGVFLKGAEHITLEKAIEELCSKSKERFPKEIKSFAKRVDASMKTLNAHDQDTAHVGRAIELLTKEIEAFDKLIEAADKGIDAAEKMVEAGHDVEAYKTHALENERYAKEAHQLAIKSLLVGLYIYATSRKIYSKDLKVKADEEHLIENLDDRKTRVERSKLILNAAKTAAIHLKPVFKEARAKLRHSLQAPRQWGGLAHGQRGWGPDSLEAMGISRATLEAYLEQGNWVYVYMSCMGGLFTTHDYEDLYDRAMKLKYEAIQDAMYFMRKDKRQALLDYNEFISKAYDAGQEKDFDTALTYLYGATTLFPDKLKARWGLATTYAMKHNHAEAVGYYDELVKDFPDHPQIAFERGVVTMCVELEKGVAQVEEAVSRFPGKFEHYYASLGHLFRAKQDNERAKRYFEKYLEYYPDDEEVSKLVNQQDRK